MREASTGVPLRTASMTTCAPPSMRLACTSTWARLDAATHCAVRQAAQPAKLRLLRLLRLLRGQRRGFDAERRIEHGADVVEADVAALGQQARRGQEVCGYFSPRRWPTISARRWRGGFASVCRAALDWKHTSLAAQCGGQALRAAAPAARPADRPARASAAPRRRCGCRGTGRCRSAPRPAAGVGCVGARPRPTAGRAARVQREHQVVVAAPSQAWLSRTR